MRELTEQVQVPPVNARYRVFIVDEVHMLSTQAFNAFLIFHKNFTFASNLRGCKNFMLRKVKFTDASAITDIYNRYIAETMLRRL